MNFDRLAGTASAAFLVLSLLITVWLGLWGKVATLTWSDAGEFVKVLGSIATGGAAVTGAIVAWRGLEKWRRETIGTKKAELAATVLAEFYEADEIIRSARSPWVMVHEMSAIDGVPDEIASNSSYAPERRLSEYVEFFARFRSRKHAFSAVFGREAAKPFDELWDIRLEINHAVDSMLRNKEIQSSRDPEHRSLWLSWYNVAFRPSDVDKDPLLPRLKNAISSMEATCRPAINAAI